MKIVKGIMGCSRMFVCLAGIGESHKGEVATSCQQWCDEEEVIEEFRETMRCHAMPVLECNGKK